MHNVGSDEFCSMADGTTGDIGVVSTRELSICRASGAEITTGKVGSVSTLAASTCMASGMDCTTGMAGTTGGIGTVSIVALPVRMASGSYDNGDGSVIGDVWAVSTAPNGET